MGQGIATDGLTATITTDINPILGALLILIDLATIIGAGVGILASCIIACTIHSTNKKQLEQQKKIDSARLSQKMLEYWDDKKHKDFSDMVCIVFDNSKMKDDDSRISHYLSIWEEIAVFCNEGIIIKNHMKEFFKGDLEAIRNNTIVYKYLEKKHTETTYHNLWELIENTYS